MKTYIRVLLYARPLGKYIFPFVLFSIVSSVFGVLNFSLLQPLLDVLFDKVTLSDVSPESLKRPAFDVIDISRWFNYYFGVMMREHGKMGALKYVCAAIVGSVLIANVSKYFAVRVIETFKARTVANLRQAVFDKTLGLHLGFFSNERKGDLMARITTDVQEIESSIGKVFSAVFKEIFTLLFYVLTLFSMSVQLTFFSLVILPISGIFIGVLAKKLKEKALDVQERLANVISILDESFGGIRVVKGFNAEHFIKKRFSEENKGYRNAVIRMLFRQELASPFSEVMGVTVVAGILLYGGSLVLSSQSTLSASTFVTYLIIFSQVLRPAKEISNAVSNVQRGVASGERIFRLIDMPLQMTDIPNAPIIEEFRHEIVFDKVKFEYEKGVPVLHGISFDIQKGHTVALVGASGSGKSTIADLVPRFYDPTSGCIKIDGVEVSKTNTHSLRQLMGIVTQESILFNDTIYNNIAFGIDATKEQVIAAAKIAHAHDFIEDTPQGYQTIIGDRGTKLSGGQRQRLSIARAILKNPPILILDEATSALDTESEKLVQDALTQLMKKRTSLVIAHRLSTIQHADKIVVLNQGQIVEQGTHNELIKKEDGFYRKLSMMQGGIFG